MSAPTYGSRRLVLQNLQRQTKGQQPFRGGYGADNNTEVEPGNINLYSFSNPGLTTGDTYTASFTQSISYSGGDTQTLISQKQFKTAGSPYTLDASLINSVYPPPGHSDYWNVVPHVLFNDSKVPWMFKGTEEDTPTSPFPWLALLVFTEDELTPTEDQLTTISGKIGTTERTPTFAYNLQVKDLVGLSGIVSQPVPESSSNDATPVQAIFLQSSLYSRLFGTYTNQGLATADQKIEPANLTRLKCMSHVRRFNTTGVSNQDAFNVQELAATLSPRTGPPDITLPITAHAHLVSLSGIAYNDNMSCWSKKPTALVSLYSWSFTYLPPLNFAAAKVLESLGTSLQPLRLSDTTLSSVQATSGSSGTTDAWTKNKILAGYTILKYRSPTGESTVALNRSFLTAVKFDPLNFQPSNYGSELALVDESKCFLVASIAFQLYTGMPSHQHLELMFLELVRFWLSRSNISTCLGTRAYNGYRR